MYYLALYNLLFMLGEWKNSRTHAPEKNVRVVREGHVASDKVIRCYSGVATLHLLGS